jgi:FlaA1/EpsC-like NDP-sugar epimerase
MLNENFFEDILEQYNQNLEESIHHRFGYKKVIIFGAGSYGQRIASFLKHRGVEIVFFLDNDKSKKTLL